VVPTKSVVKGIVVLPAKFVALMARVRCRALKRSMNRDADLNGMKIVSHVLVSLNFVLTIIHVYSQMQ